MKFRTTCAFLAVLSIGALMADAAKPSSTSPNANKLVADASAMAPGAAKTKQSAAMPSSTAATSSDASVVVEVAEIDDVIDAAAPNLYLVMMDLAPISPWAPHEQITTVVENSIIPGIRYLKSLHKQGKILGGGAVTGSKSIVFIIKAASNDDLNTMLLKCPFWGLARTKVLPLDNFGQRVNIEKSLLKAFQSRTQRPQPAVPSSSTAK